jgi:hypothetical protein
MPPQLSHQQSFPISDRFPKISGHLLRSISPPQPVGGFSFEQRATSQRVLSRQQY